MFHFKPLMENLVLIYNNWQQLKWDMVKSKKKNSKKKLLRHMDKQLEHRM